MAESVTQYGITITLDDDYTVGQFVTGDYYIVAPSGVSITGGTVDDGGRNINSSAGRDGIVVNPSAGTQGYDSRGTGYNSELTKAFPFTANPGDSIVVYESADPAIPVSGGAVLIYGQSAIVVTVLASAPTATAFRPQYCAGDKTIYDWADVDTATDLPGIATVTGAPTFAAAFAPIDRVFIDEGLGWPWRMLHPVDNMPDYGRDIANILSTALLASLLDPDADQANHDTLVQHLIQRGIDFYGMLQAGAKWTADGGHGQGRKAPIVYAGYLLGVSAMQDVGYSLSFHEDGQTFYVTSFHVALNVGYDAEDLGMADWTKNGSVFDPSYTSSYRTANAPYWLGHALTVCALGLQTNWGHPAYFDYVDRFNELMGDPYTIFAQNMEATYWDTYYAAPPPAPLLRVRAVPRS